VTTALPTEPYIRPPFIVAISASIYNNMLTYIVIDCQLLTFCIKIHAREMYLDTYTFPFFVTTGGSLVWSVEKLRNKRNTTQRTEQLPKRIVSFIKLKASTG